MDVRVGWGEYLIVRNTNQRAANLCVGMNATAAVALTTCTAIWDGTGATIAATSHRNSPARCADVSSVADPIWGPMRCGVIASRLLQWTFNERIESNRLKTCAFLPLHLSLSLSLSLLSLYYLYSRSHYSTLFLAITIHFFPLIFILKNQFFWGHRSGDSFPFSLFFFVCILTLGFILSFFPSLHKPEIEIDRNFWCLFTVRKKSSNPLPPTSHPTSYYYSPLILFFDNNYSIFVKDIQFV